MEITLPVSLGEAVDKLTILHIKIEKIKDNNYAKKEYDLIYNKIKNYIEKYYFFYKILKSINLEIWEMQDDFRVSKNDKIKTDLCKKIIVENDRRFRVKKKINTLCNSLIREIKGYIPKTACVVTHLGLGDNITAIGAVRYISTLYEKVIIFSKERNIKNVELFYSDDNTIEVCSVKDDAEMYSKIKIMKNTELFKCGFHHKNNKVYEIPFSFYDDMKIKRDYFWEYFYVPDINDNLFEFVKDKEYVFIHNTCSSGRVFNIEYVENKLNISKNKILFINPCYNIYNKGHEYYETANKFINKPLIYYKKIIINSKYIVLSDSSFFCLALNLEIKTDKCFIKTRGRNYDHLKTTKYNRRKFIAL